MDCKKCGKSINKLFIKICSTSRGFGGAARSWTTIIKLLLKQGHKVEFIPFRNSVSSKEIRFILDNELSDTIVTENYDTINEHCDVFFMYADDYIWEFTRPDISDIFSGINADKKVMAINYRRGKAGEIEWTRNWDSYLFLNPTQERDFLVAHGRDVHTKSMAPCTDLSPFFPIQPNYNTNLRIVRHSSQGDVKFYKSDSDADINKVNQDQVRDFYNKLLATRPDLTIDMLPGPSFIEPSERFRKHPRTAATGKIAEFLSLGNIFEYRVPKLYQDMGPRVIMESMSSGIPVIANKGSGGADARITPETGWLCSSDEEYINIIKNVTFEELKKKGEAAKERARTEFVPERWIEEILE